MTRLIEIEQVLRHFGRRLRKCERSFALRDWIAIRILGIEGDNAIRSRSGSRLYYHKGFFTRTWCDCETRRIATWAGNNSVFARSSFVAAIAEIVSFRVTGGVESGYRGARRHG